MRSLLAALASASLLLATSGCGSGSKDTAPTPRAAAKVAPSTAPTTSSSRILSGHYFENDRDPDADDTIRDGERGPADNGDLLRSYPGTVTQSESRVIATTIRHYYAAAAAGNGTEACSLLSTNLSMSLAEGQGGSIHDTAKRCGAAVRPLFMQQHGLLVADDAATMIVTGVHVKGSFGLAFLGFQQMPEGEILIEREGAAWKVDALFDSLLP